MRSRRSVLGLATTLIGGGLFAGAPVRARGATWTDRPRGATDPHVEPVRPAGGATRSVDAPITVSGSIDPSILRVTGLPEPLAAVLARERDRYRSLSIDAVDRVGGRATLRRTTPIGGRISAVGSFDPDAIEADLARHEREFVAIEDGNGGIEDENGGADSARTDPARRFVEVDGEYAVALSASTVRIGYGLGREWALDRERARDPDRPAGGPSVTAAALARPTGVAGQTGAAARLRSVLSGDAIGYATLTPGGRDALAAELPAGADALASAIRSAGAIGAAMRAGQERTRLRYGLVASGRGPGQGTLDELAAVARADPAVEDVAIHRDGPTAVLDATVDTAAIWSAHRRGGDELAD